MESVWREFSQINIPIKDSFQFYFEDQINFISTLISMIKSNKLV